MSEQSRRDVAIEFGRLAEIIGIIGIVGSLSFLGYELKRSNDLAEAAAISEVYRATNRMGLAMAGDPEMRWVFGQAQSDFGSLQADDIFTLYVLAEYVINSTEVACKYYDKGIINREEADYFTQGLCRLIEMDAGMVTAWQQNKDNRIPGFYDYVGEVCVL